MERAVFLRRCLLFIQRDDLLHHLLNCAVSGHLLRNNCRLTSKEHSERREDVHGGPYNCHTERGHLSSEFRLLFDCAIRYMDKILVTLLTLLICESSAAVTSNEFTCNLYITAVRMPTKKKHRCIKSSAVSYYRTTSSRVRQRAYHDSKISTYLFRMELPLRISFSKSLQQSLFGNFVHH